MLNTKMIAALALAATATANLPTGCEWAGVFTLTANTPYTWIAGAKKGAYGPSTPSDTSMKLLMLPTTATTQAGIEATEATAAPIFGGTATEITVHTAAPMTSGTLYNLNFDAESFMSTYTIKVPTTSAYTFFAEHVPIEFEVDYHYLLDANKEAIEPSAEEGAGAHDHGGGSSGGKTHDLGTAALASILTAACSFFGLIMLIPFVQKVLKPSYAFAFASGCLLAVAGMLMWPESLHLIPVNMGKPKEAEVSAVFAVMVLLGFVTEPTIKWFLSHVIGLKMDADEPANTEVVKAGNLEGELEAQEGGEAAPAPAAAKKPIDWSLALGITFGDGAHNIVDGVMIGLAFKLCDTTTAWSVASGAIGHELSQELGDFLVLTSGAGLSTCGALGVNFIAACTCIIATLIAHSVDIDDTTMGCLLAYGGGTYMFIATVSCFARIPSNGGADSMIHCFLFVLGAVVIGLVLLDHEHCSAGGAHAGHNH